MVFVYLMLHGGPSQGTALWARSLKTLYALTPGFCSNNPTGLQTQLQTRSEINFLTLRPSWLVDEMIYRPSIFNNIKTPFCFTRQLQYFIEMINSVEYKLKEKVKL